MAANTATEADAELYDDHTPSNAVTYKFKTTEENRTASVPVTVNDKVKNYVTETAIRSAKWRSVSQFVNDALLFYLDATGETRDVEEILEVANRTSENQLTASVTPTLFYEMEAMVNHPHTPWRFKQDFYTCALFSYIEAGCPSMKGLRR
ncbi:hypothetical protein HRTV-14_gp105 [Halorubrum phage HRTV-14]|uniref:Uncharacterized protein n=1 Tax=Halorubrum phage HRTV-14 TaxID=2877994 RepID=A0AAE9BUV8_9CAUD|nr:hypothetical protein HRTV-14_gp105 [Halorubrum phage HRTV-14]